MFGGKGLFRISFRVDVDEDGVRTGDWLDSLDDPTEDGDEVPSFPSFFLDALLGSLPRESYATSQLSVSSLQQRMEEGWVMIYRAALTTLWLKRFILVDNSFSRCGTVRDAQPNSRGAITV